MRIHFTNLFQSTAFRIILLAFIIYNVNMRAITSFDTYPTRYLPISIINEFDLDLDEFPFLQKYPDILFQKFGGVMEGEIVEKNDLPYYTKYVRGHYMSAYPVMPAILSLPVYVVPVLLGLTEGSGSAVGYSQTEVVGTLLSKISASAAVAISVGIMYLTLLRLTKKRYAFWIALMYGFATSSWSVSSQGLWQSAMSQPCLAFALYYFVKAREDSRNIIYASIPLALSVACRPQDIIFAVVFFVYVVHKHRERVLPFIVFPMIIGTLLLTYNIHYFGSMLGGYGKMDSVASASDEITDLMNYADTQNVDLETQNVDDNSQKNSIKTQNSTYTKFLVTVINLSSLWSKRLLGLLISPGRGLLFYSPVLIFAFVGMAGALRNRQDPVLTYTGIATVITILFYATIWGWGWSGGSGYSYRMLVELLPGLCLFMAVIYNRIVSYKWILVLLILFAGFSVIVQITGAFFYPCDWYVNANQSNKDGEHLFWDWQNPEFLQCLKSGPIEPHGVTFIKEILTKQ